MDAMSLQWEAELPEAAFPELPRNSRRSQAALQMGFSLPPLLRAAGNLPGSPGQRGSGSTLEGQATHQLPFSASDPVFTQKATVVAIRT